MIHLALLLMTMFGIDVALAASRDLIVIVEEPYIDSSNLPTPEQRETVGELREALTRRILELQIEYHEKWDGMAAVQQGDVARIKKADVIFQVLFKVDGRGLKYEAQLYERDRDKWIPVSARPLKWASAEKLETLIADDLLPRLVVRAHEIAKAAGPPILFTDCVFAPLNNTAIEPLARSVSQQYASRLAREISLIRRFGVVRLVPPVPTDFQWWCVHLQRPRLGSLRSDTITVYGLIEQLSPTVLAQVLIVVGRPDRNVTSREYIPLDPQDWEASLKRIAEIVEGLTNDL